ncbi:hypothetical protein OAH97_01085 [Octadecabacter sp.]|nr:hypothetical protein [Octadecabacter sp.]
MSKKLLVQKGENHTLSEGASRFTVVTIEDGATLTFTGSTTLMADQLVTGSGSEIRYASSEYNDNAVFTLNALDSSQVKELRFVGNGKPGNGHASQSRAAEGKRGKNARDPQLFKTSGNKAQNGGRGANGGEGSTGEDAVDFVINLPRIAQGALINVQAVGGLGGGGQGGGKGGRGGNGSTFHDGRHGGHGGNGGDGGDGGDAGRVYTFFVVPDGDIDDEAVKKDIIQKTTVQVDSAPGDGGSGGSGGAGGQPGSNAPIGAGGKKAGDPGQDGTDGDLGDGPKAGAVGDVFVQVDFLSQSKYQQYIAQVIGTP